MHRATPPGNEHFREAIVRPGPRHFVGFSTDPRTDLTRTHLQHFVVVVVVVIGVVEIIR